MTPLHTYNALRATVGPCDAYRLASMDQQALLTAAYRTAMERQPKPARQGMPIELDGPHYGRKRHQRRMALLRAAVALVAALACTVGLPMLAGVLRGLGVY